MKKKYRLKKIKVGHAGTLDPLATGLLLICTGKKTKEIEKLQALKKTYYTTFYFGATTPSFDLETDIDQVYGIEHINNDHILDLICYVCLSFYVSLQSFSKYSKYIIKMAHSMMAVFVLESFQIIINRM